MAIIKPNNNTLSSITALPAAIPTGSYVKLHSTTMSSAAASVDINGYFSSDYDAYEVIGMNVKSATDNQYLSMRVITSAGAQASSMSSILPGWMVNASSAQSHEVNYAKGAARFYLHKMAQHQSSMFRLLITFPLKTDEHKVYICHSGGEDYISGSDVQQIRVSSGRYEADTALTGLRFLTGDDSNLTSGTFTMYGIKN